MPVNRIADELLNQIHVLFISLICLSWLSVSTMPYSLLYHVDDQGLIIDETLGIVASLVGRHYGELA